MPVHEFGHPVDLEAVLGLARHHGLAVVEDAACAIGATVGGAKVGTMGTIGCFSLHPRKTLTTGEGGILVTGDDALAARLRRLRNHGMERSEAGMRFHEPGFNYRLTDFQSALGRAQLGKLQSWIEARRRLAATYRRALQPLAARGRLVPPADHPGHSWQTYMVVLADGIDRAAVIARLAEAQIEVNLGAQCLSALPPFEAFAPDVSGVAARLYRQGMALPFCEQYTAADVERVVAALTRALD